MLSQLRRAAASTTALAISSAVCAGNPPLFFTDLSHKAPPGDQSSTYGFSQTLVTLPFVVGNHVRSASWEVWSFCPRVLHCWWRPSEKQTSHSWRPHWHVFYIPRNLGYVHRQPALNYSRLVDEVLGALFSSVILGCLESFLGDTCTFMTDCRTAWVLMKQFQVQILRSWISLQDTSCEATTWQCLGMISILWEESGVEFPSEECSMTTPTCAFRFHLLLPFAPATGSWMSVSLEHTNISRSPIRDGASAMVIQAALAMQLMLPVLTWWPTLALYKLSPTKSRPLAQSTLLLEGSFAFWWGFAAAEN